MFHLIISIMVGLQYGRLTVLQLLGGGRLRARCECGKEKDFAAAHVKGGRSSSCGCLRAEMLSARRLTHGRTETREYSIWSKMKARCYTPGTTGFAHWGGRGITVCEAWRSSFEAFLEDMGPCPEGGTLDRIDADGNYEPANCRWLDMQGQQNNRRNNVRVTYQGREQTIAEWARELGLKYPTLRRRLVHKGEPPEVAFRPELKSGVSP